MARNANQLQGRTEGIFYLIKLILLALWLNTWESIINIIMAKYYL